MVLGGGIGAAQAHVGITKAQRARGQTVTCPGGDNQDGQGLVTEQAGMRRAQSRLLSPSREGQGR